jgi:uncharacterized phiE125 gp8 family phage protein
MAHAEGAAASAPANPIASPTALKDARMSPILIEPPADEPVSLADAKLYLRIDSADEDALIATLVTAARLLIEAASGRFLVTQGWRLVLDRWPSGGRIALPLSPVQAVAAARVAQGAGWTALGPGMLALEPGDPPILALAGPVPHPTTARGGIAIELTAGYGPPSAVPLPLKQAILVLVARWYEGRGDVAQGMDARLPGEAMALIAAYRRARL